MGNRFASGKWAIAQCDRCGFRYKLKELKKEIIKTKQYNLKVCQQCWDPDHPQLQLGMYPVYDPQAVREPRNDGTYYVAGTGADGYPTGGSRQIQWGFNPVGMRYDYNETPNALKSISVVNSVTIS